eukprot:gb/GECH01006805.1/.p1 GENE.gb/GECH01006805.1/~~gb/GECH01006805.1/.p1  ORF type:complete len:282 (+),score=33.11 gb/GECH01006805.1/:1-846(+)
METTTTNQEYTKHIAYTLGYVATACFTLQYIPQLILNHRRKTVKGFSGASVIIKLLGACFLAVNSMFTGEPMPVIVYGIFNVIQYLGLVFQFAMLSGDKIWMLWSFFPLVPYAMDSVVPISIAITNLIKPVSQVVSHIPQLQECVRIKSTQGVSLVSQYLNLMGGIAGLLMLLLVPPQSILTYLLYINSMLQAVTLFYLAVQYDGYTRLISEFDGMLFRMLPSRYVPFSHPTSEHDDSDRPDEGDDGRRDSEKSHGGDNDDDRNHKYVHRSKRKQTIEERV